MKEIITIFIGGGLGSITRYSISYYFNKWDINILPFATLVSNLLSTLVIALFIFFISKNQNFLTYSFVVTGFCGGFSTFSTFSYETFLLFNSGKYFETFFIILLNVLLCFLSIYIIMNLSIQKN